ncbi:ABC transporter ATP-binding protein [Paracoccus siganidrum]|uniref:ABC transporter ATP-binding protein n=1 Tax=Paracoccus siganidrum TaxID=1276757 RepID=A0A419A3B2_9RHOB|nr:ABC transporter ATP-binding protein [Paracoccus siganidrum]RJL08087.1 ABC transporter ATP-binding protein [Paracoccus siganidrum]RMC25480.1 Fe3+/spermidine/putrescine ABC transporter ATP-binding protein [Paracoccus siganidrum]
MSTLTLRGLAKTYAPNVRAVKSIDLEVQSGEFVSLLGSSGCGKTTTLQMVAGFVAPTAGQVLLDGRDVTYLEPDKRDMGVVFQSYALFPHMTVTQNVRFGLEMRRLPESEIKERVAEALSMVRLAGLDDRYPSELSGGQRQRVAIARVLAIRPRVLLLDEPMSNLDAKLRGEMHVELRGLQRRLGITTILVTHDQVEAMTMSDRIAVMANGTIAELGTPQEVYDIPATEFAFNFLGQSNTITGKVLGHDDSFTQVRVGSSTINIPQRNAGLAGDVRFFIRPERLMLTSPETGIITGRVATRLFLGNTWTYEIDSPLGRLRVIKVNTRGGQPQEGDQVGIKWNEADMQSASEEIAHV